MGPFLPYLISMCLSLGITCQVNKSNQLYSYVVHVDGMAEVMLRESFTEIICFACPYGHKPDLLLEALLKCFS